MPAAGTPILNHMVQFASAQLDVAFAALSDATRRGVLERLGRRPSIADLAETFRMTLTGMKKHVGVLEQAGLVATAKVGRVRTCRLGRCRLRTKSESTGSAVRCGARASTSWTR